MDWLWGIPTGHMDEDTIWRARERVEPVVSLSRGPFCNSCGSPTGGQVKRLGGVASLPGRTFIHSSRWNIPFVFFSVLGPPEEPEERINGMECNE